MNSKELLERKSAVYQMGLLFNQQPTDERINAYAKALMNYEPNQIIFAFKQVIHSGSAFFPSLAEILKHLKPATESNQDKAPQVATEILNALRTFGPHDEGRMFESVSDEAKLVLRAIGYTGDYRNSENIETVRAQIERLARGVLSSRDAEQKNQALEKIGINTENVLKLSKPGMKKIDFSLPNTPTEGA